MRATLTQLPKGLVWGSGAAVTLYLTFIVWTSYAPRQGEGAFDVITVIAYGLGFPTSLVLDRVAVALENANVDDHLTLLHVALLSVPLNWGLLGAIVSAIRKGGQDRR